ncbi:asparagine synthase-related protein [Clostridium weizhouense]|uniref:Asparagine synthetase domain-containing protein n=1 Tax=Clostridium weizhouense TaxID=2859781 RepID=A0ABS7ASH1_9CLOT|nr:hypothetical protein [Clostridium weizhouense]
MAKGFLLSGGLDSSLVCSVAQKLYPKKKLNKYNMEKCLLRHAFLKCLLFFIYYLIHAPEELRYHPFIHVSCAIVPSSL